MYLKSLNERYAYGVLLRLAENPTGMMFSELSDEVKNPYTREKILKVLEADGLIRMKERMDRGRKQYLIALTEKGKRVAELLKKVDMMGIKRGKFDPCHANFISKVRELEDAFSREKFVSFDCEGRNIKITGRELLDMIWSWVIYSFLGIYNRRTYEIMKNVEDKQVVGLRSNIIDLLGYAKDGWVAHLGIMAEAIRKYMDGKVKADAINKMLRRATEIINHFEKILGEMLHCKGFKVVPAIMEELQSEYFESGLMLLVEYPESELSHTTVKSWASGACEKWSNREKKPWSTLLKNADTILMAFSEIPFNNADAVEKEKLQKAESMLMDVVMKVVPSEDYDAVASERRDVERMFWLGDEEIEGDEEMFFVKLPGENHIVITKSVLKNLAVVLNFGVLLKVREEYRSIYDDEPEFYRALIDAMERHEATLRETLKILKNKGVVSDFFRYIKREVELKNSLERTWSVEVDEFEAELMIETLLSYIITARDIWADIVDYLDTGDVSDMYYVELTRVAEQIDEYKKEIIDIGAQIERGILNPAPLSDEERKKFRTWSKKWRRETKKWHEAVEDFREIVMRHYYEEENKVLQEMEQ